MGFVTSVGSALAPRFIDHMAREYSVGLTDGMEEGDLEVALMEGERLMKEGFQITFDVLGESARTPEEAEIFMNYFRDAVDMMITRGWFDIEKVNALKSEGALNPYASSPSLSLKPSAFLDRYEEFFEEMANKGQKHGFSIAIDQEDIEEFIPNVAMYRRMAKQFDNVDFVLQTNVNETERVIAEFKDIENASGRVCSGIYKIRKTRGKNAYGTNDKFEQKKRLIRHVQEFAKAGKYIEAATHDVVIISYLNNWFKQEGIPKTNFEFQALYHINPQKLTRVQNKLMRHLGLTEDDLLSTSLYGAYEKLIKDGVNVRIYLPFAPSVSTAKLYGMRRADRNPALFKIFAKQFIPYLLNRNQTQ